MLFNRAVESTSGFVERRGGDVGLRLREGGVDAMSLKMAFSKKYPLQAAIGG